MPASHRSSQAASQLPSHPSASSSLSTAVWPLFLIVVIAVTMTLLALFTTMELATYIHSRSVPRGAVWVIVGSYLVTVVTWLYIAVRSSWYSWKNIDRPRKWFVHHFKYLPWFILCFVVLGYGLRLSGFALIGFKMYFNAPFVLALSLMYEAFKATLLYCCWLGMAFGVLSFARVRQQAEHLLVAQKSLVEAKLTQLQGQLRPHFLFNTLNTISALMYVDVGRADNLLTKLGDLLRANLQVSERDVVPLADELALLRQYAEIMQERFSDRVTIEWTVDSTADDQLLRAQIPTMLLQPLLENAFKHGLEKSTGREKIKVSIHIDSNTLQLEIHNTGSALAERFNEGFGVRNCRERLQLLYGESASLALMNDSSGVLARVILPWQRGH